MSNVASAPMRTSLMAALFCAASQVLPCSHARQSEADRKALAQLRTQAEQGDVKAQNELGEAFYAGKGDVARVEAVKWFRKAAEQGHAPAQHHLGVAFYKGEGGEPRDWREAARWFRKAALCSFICPVFSSPSPTPA